MAAKLTVRYDEIGDILYIETCLPYQEQDSQELAGEVGVRLNLESGDVETVEINFFSKRMSDVETLSCL